MRTSEPSYAAKWAANCISDKTWHRKPEETIQIAIDDSVYSACQTWLIKEQQWVHIAGIVFNYLEGITPLLRDSKDKTAGVNEIIKLLKDSFPSLKNSRVGLHNGSRILK